MRKIFCITCHKVTSPLKITVNYLSSFENNEILIHVDSKSNLDDFLFLESKNVTLLTERVNVSWGGVSQINATLLLLKRAIDVGFDYLFFLSGDDLPCMSDNKINLLLSRIECKNLIHYQDERSNYVNPITRVKYNYPDYFFTKEKKLSVKLKKKAFLMLKFFFINKSFAKSISRGVVFYKGTNWFSFNHKTVCEVVSFVNGNDWFLSLFERSFCGDEVFFHTLLKFIGINDIYHDPSKPSDALRYIDWNTGPDYPRILDNNDIDKINKSGCIFARKFSDTADSSLLNKILTDA
ncbi:TPA: beta-1,6-N-acetylglucosaminyltransferase [Klebsiella pneumoniae]|nr:core-2/I-branching enzyme [Klebsiella pneumoniae]